MCIAVGKLSFDDWPLLTWSLGWTGSLPPRCAGQLLVGPAGDHFIGVHVRLGARPGLPDDQRELAVEVAARDFARRLLDRLGDLRRRARRSGHSPAPRPVSQAQRMDDLGRHPLALAEREIGDRALGLRAPIAVAGHLDRAEAVGFGAGVGAMAFLDPSCRTCPASSCSTAARRKRAPDQVRGDGASAISSA